MNHDKRIAIVTGGNRGLGFEVCRQLAKNNLKVILTSRDQASGNSKTEELKSEGLDVTYKQLDVSNSDSIAALYQAVEQEFGWIEILINNAGVLLDRDENIQHHPSQLFQTEKETFIRTFETNVIGAFQMCEAFVPGMKEHKYGRVVNVSSGMGQLSDMGAGYPAYRISKTALSGVTRYFSSQTNGTNVLVNAVCPGWVKTDMGGPNAPRTIDQGVDTIVWAALLPDSGPNGEFFRDRHPIPW